MSDPLLDQYCGSIFWVSLLGGGFILLTQSKKLEIFHNAKHALGVYYLVNNCSLDFDI